MSKELEEKLVKDAAQALSEHKDALLKSIKEGDALLEAKMTNTANQVATTIEEMQKLQLKAKDLEEKNKELEAAIARNPNVKSNEVDSYKEARAEAMDVFIRKGAMRGTAGGQVKFADFLAEFAEQKGLEAKALSVNSNVDGGFLVLPEFGGVVQTQIFETSPIRLYADTVTISTDAYEFVDDFDEADAEWVSETGTRSTTGTPQVAKRIIPTHEIYAKPKATQKMLEDGIVNVESWLTSKIADKFSRKENTSFVTGDGSGKPKGFCSYAAGSSSYAQDAIEQVNSGTTSAPYYTYSGLVGAVTALKEEYLTGAIWAGSRSTLGYLLKVVDGEQRPIFNMTYDKNTRTFGSMLGIPVAIFNDMASAATTNNLALAIGDFRRGYQIVDRRGISLLRDPYSSKPFVEFYATKRVGGAVKNFEAIKLVKTAS